MTVREILPFIDKEDKFIILDQNGKASSVEVGQTELVLRDIMNKPITQITKYKYDPYAEETFIALRVAYNKEVIE